MKKLTEKTIRNFTADELNYRYEAIRNAMHNGQTRTIKQTEKLYNEYQMLREEYDRRIYE